MSNLILVVVALVASGTHDLSGAVVSGLWGFRPFRRYYVLRRLPNPPTAYLFSRQR